MQLVFFCQSQQFFVGQAAPQEEGKSRGQFKITDSVIAIRSDVFRITSLGQSLLGAFDRITDFSIGADSLDGPNAVAAAEVAKLGSLTALSEAGLATVLTTTSFLADKAATFTFGSGSTTRTFVALNDAVAGFQATGDALIEITGYAGDLRGLAVI